VQLYEELLQITSSEAEIDRQDIRTTLDTIYEQQPRGPIRIWTGWTSAVGCGWTTPSVAPLPTCYPPLKTSIRSRYGWAHEESLSQMEEIVSLYTKQGKSQTIAHALLLHVATKQLSATSLVWYRVRRSLPSAKAAKSIASGYIAAGQIQKAKELLNDIYLQIITKDLKVDVV
jgi:hypothetical protein